MKEPSKEQVKQLLSAAEDTLRFMEAGHCGASHALDCVYISLRDVVNECRGRDFWEKQPVPAEDKK